ncbi:MAG: 2-dehydropantoate 2-reductase [Candidatus Promineifilaceae bacterium]|nr:2-dehydropantoate 2-reductase [Candidatus Promineifilaceae bacterium]
MRVAIIGSGSLASLFAVKLVDHVDLFMLGHWHEQISHLQTEGMLLINLDGTRNRRYVPVYDEPAAVAPADLALILVKSYQTLRAAGDTAVLLTDDGVAITLQNGLGNKDQLESVLGANRVLQGVTTLGANLLAPGTIHHAGLGQVYLAEPNKNNSFTRTAVVRELVDSLNFAGFDTKLIADVVGLVWGKLAVNAGINPLSALLHVPNGYLLENEGVRHLLVGAAKEVAAVASALDISLPYEYPEEQIVRVARQTASNYSSMLKDVLRGAPTEIKAICGAIIEHGKRAGIPTPINSEFYRLVTAQTEQLNDFIQTYNSEGRIAYFKPLKSEIETLDRLLSNRRFPLDNLVSTMKISINGG